MTVKSQHWYQANVPQGLEPLATQELHTLADGAIRIRRTNLAGEIRFSCSELPTPLHDARLVSSIQRVLRFEVPRPRSLLEETRLDTITRAAKAIVGANSQKWNGLRIEAAGKGSQVMQRIGEEISSRLELPWLPEEGELAIRILPTSNHWEVLLRTTPRPLSTRAWRSHNLPGALNGCIASAMAVLSAPHKRDNVVDLTCGSGSLLIERGLLHPYQSLVGFDFSKEAISAAETHVHACALPRVTLHCSELENASRRYSNVFDVALCNLPWGERVGQRQKNQVLYTSVLKTLVRCTKRGARIILLTQDSKTLQGALQEQNTHFSLLEAHKISQSGFHPSIFCLEHH